MSFLAFEVGIPAIEYENNKPSRASCPSGGSSHTKILFISDGSPFPLPTKSRRLETSCSCFDVGVIVINKEFPSIMSVVGHSWRLGIHGRSLYLKRVV